MHKKLILLVLLSTGVIIFLLYNTSKEFTFYNTPKKNAFHYYYQGMDAYQRKDYPAFLENLKNAMKLAPDNPNFIFGLARAYALNGNKEAAVKLLERAVNVGWDIDLEETNDFDSLKHLEKFKDILRKKEKISIVVNNSKIAFKIPEKDLMPEGIAYDPVEKKFYIGSTYKCKIISIDKKNTIKDFTKEKQDGLLSVVGMKVDAKRRILWANSVASSKIKGHQDKSYGYTCIFKYNLTNGKLIKKYVLDERPILHAFNDLTINSQGDVFITDSPRGALYAISHKKDRLELFIEPRRLTYPNGIDISKSEKYLFVSHAGGIAEINVNTRSIHNLPHPENVVLTPIDGLYFYQNSLIAIQRNNKRDYVVQYFLDNRTKKSAHLKLLSSINDYFFPESKELSFVEKYKIIESGNPLFVLPTTGVIVGDMFYYIANSQITSDNTIYPEDKLQEIVILKVKL